MKTIHVEVTQEDIEKGIRENACECPIARAVTRATGYQCSIRVSGSLLHNGRECSSSFQISGDAARFVARFDKGLPVEPFSFDFDLFGAA